jgi:ergothioneine biosynthesis protein EgtB
MIETSSLGQPFGSIDFDSRSLADRYRAVRRASDALCGPLDPEDCCIQTMPEVSPTKWHMAHTTWFFETFVLKPALPDFRSPDPQYEYLFNSYYNTVGRQYARPERGHLSRPTLAGVMDYRAQVDEAMEELFANYLVSEADQELLAVLELGTQHEQQHQELMLMDIKHVFSCNPLRPAYRGDLLGTLNEDVPPLNWLRFDGALQSIGHDSLGFAFDNERPQHRAYVESFQIADRLTTCGEYLEFIDDRGYDRPELWLSDAWNIIQTRGWNAPLYWECEDGQWRTMTLGGMRDLNPSEPVCHISYYEADAYARWMGCWLPRESVWETVASQLPVNGNFREEDRLHPAPLTAENCISQPAQLFGDVWEWTCSPYSAYPGYRAKDGALGEYNGKFMCNQMILRGGSCVTPISHMRATYRNFFPPDARWPFTGIRLTKESV